MKTMVSGYRLHKLFSYDIKMKDLTEKEIKSLEEIAKLCPEWKAFTRGDVDCFARPEDTSEIGVLVREFMKRWAEDRNFKINSKKIIGGYGLFRFESVGMHIDSITPKGYLTGVIPVKGKGELSHMIRRKIVWGSIKECMFESGDNAKLLIFNDNLPHSFDADSPCYAIIFAAPKKEFEKLT